MRQTRETIPFLTVRIIPSVDRSRGRGVEGWNILADNRRRNSEIASMNNTCAGYRLDIKACMTIKKNYQQLGIPRGSVLFSLLAYLLLTPTIAMADPQLSINMVAEKEITVVEDGAEVIRRVPTLEIESGATLYFTLKIVNSGDEAATNVVVDNPVPDETRYVEGSAGGVRTTVTFSIDNGGKYAIADDLMYEFTKFNGEKEMRQAQPEMYTDIRWVVEDIPPGADGDLYFQVTVD
jgi:uncharacterized repeat protein (TIGR01451 family)